MTTTGDHEDASLDSSASVERPTPDPENPAGFRDDPAPGSINQATSDPAALANKFLERAYFSQLHRSCDKPDEHPLRGSVCFLADFVIRFVAAALILGIAFVAAWKSLSPLPWQ